MDWVWEQRHHFEYSFISPETNKAVGESFDSRFYHLAKDAHSRSTAGVAWASLPGGEYDVKSNTPGDEGKSYHGFMVDGKYISLRDIDSTLAGYNAAKQGVAQDHVQQISGGLQQAGKWGVLMSVMGRKHGKAPNWGELDYQRIRSEFCFEKATQTQDQMGAKSGTSYSGDDCSN